MIYIYGAGKRCELIKSLLAELQNSEKIILIDNKHSKIKNVKSNNYLCHNYNYFKDTILIAVSNPDQKSKIYGNLKKKINFKLHDPIISNSATLKKNVSIGKGSIIMDNAYIGQNVKIRKNCFVGINSLVSHDTKINDFVDISHNVNIAGNVVINENSYIGIGATIIQKIQVEKNCFIGAKVLLKKNVKKFSKITLKQNLKTK